jgi:hypothetical protein
MKRRHLTALGYKVISLSSHNYNYQESIEKKAEKIKLLLSQLQ